MAKNKFVIKITPIANDDSSEIYRYISDELYRRLIIDKKEKQVIVMYVLYGT